MENSFHVHDVLDLLSKSPEGKSKEDLKSFIAQEFGPGATFCSCSVDNMGVNEVIQFMIDRKRIVEIDGGKWSADPRNKCDH